MESKDSETLPEGEGRMYCSFLQFLPFDPYHNSIIMVQIKQEDIRANGLL